MAAPAFATSRLEKHPDLDIVEVLKRITYKPHYRFSLRQELEGWWLLIAAKLPDATGREKGVLIPVQKTVQVPPYIEDKDEFMSWLEHEVMDFERHEVHEWLKLDGRCITNPHP